MANEICKTVEAFSTRLSNACVSGQALAGVTFKLNQFVDVMATSDMPMVTLRMSPASQSDNLAEGRVGGIQSMLMEVEVVGITPIEDGFADTNYSKGLLVLLENTIKAIQGSDISASNSWLKVPVYNVQGFGATVNCLYFVIRVQLQSKLFQVSSL
jgi:hypothetical protein